ncbi:unnamed protein product [Protopolystoma xenopodis]|uniref:Uncharacterized protein n=1 Tax=Protopolystoma xenopodis TaxID=117903 RepID=A0A3S5AEJ7_9PLAT|nr:unnamed protein product [Protopolystoma xenopodis]
MTTSETDPNSALLILSPGFDENPYEFGPDDLGGHVLSHVVESITSQRSSGPTSSLSSISFSGLASKSSCALTMTTPVVSSSDLEAAAFGDSSNHYSSSGTVNSALGSSSNGIPAGAVHPSRALTSMVSAIKPAGSGIQSSSLWADLSGHHPLSDQRRLAAAALLQQQQQSAQNPSVLGDLQASGDIETEAEVGRPEQLFKKLTSDLISNVSNGPGLTYLFRLHRVFYNRIMHAWVRAQRASRFLDTSLPSFDITSPLIFKFHHLYLLCMPCFADLGKFCTNC